MIMAHMKDHFLYSKWGDRIIRQIGRQDFQKLMRANDIVVGKDVRSVGRVHCVEDDLSHATASL